MCEKYNGWTNWETWNMALWLGEDDDESVRTQAFAEVEDFTDEGVVNAHEAISSMAEWLRAYCEEVYLGHLDQDDLRGPVADAIHSSYWPKVQWYEIAQHYIEEANA
jgi:hypothetical protein